MHIVSPTTPYLSTKSSKVSPLCTILLAGTFPTIYPDRSVFTSFKTLTLLSLRENVVVNGTFVILHRNKETTISINMKVIPKRRMTGGIFPINSCTSVLYDSFSIDEPTSSHFFIISFFMYLIPVDFLQVGNIHLFFQ